MEAVCARGDGGCEVRALAAALHSLHLYCAAISSALIYCCTPSPERRNWIGKPWRGQNVRGVVSLALGVVWCGGAAAASLRRARTLPLVAGSVPPLAWLASAALHLSLWTRRSPAPLLYLAIYWLLSAASATAIFYHTLTVDANIYIVDLYIQGISIVLTLVMCIVDGVCFYDEVTKRRQTLQKPATEIRNISYKHNDTHFYSKITFFWLNPLLWRGYDSPLEEDDLGDLPEDETSNKYYQKFKNIYNSNKKDTKANESSPNMLQCYMEMVWPNFYAAGIMKLLGDLMSVVPPLGLAVIIQYIENPPEVYSQNSEVTIQEFLSNGYVMLLIVTLALVLQALLSQNSTHLVTVEGTRLKSGIQAMLYDKCMRLAPWSSTENNMEEDSPLLYSPEDSSSTPTGILTNLMSQDTYNIMSCVWICHYLWAIPLKITVILYFLYTKLGISAIIGTAVSVLLITPLQFYIGKKISDNSKDISKCTDHRITKIAEILQGMTVIKLYVWEDLFNEKILNLREVELKLLNKDSIYWSFLTFTTQVSTILVTVITFIAYYYLEDSKGLTSFNVFAGLALFNQLTVPLLILPVTVMMVIQAMVSTKRIKDFLELPESNNIREDNDDEIKKTSDIFNDAFIDNAPEDEPEDVTREEADEEDQFLEDDFGGNKNDYLVRFKNAAFSWGMKNDMLIEIDDLDIPAGKLVMVVGGSGSGKSSLLSAVLGEMYIERGDVTYKGQVSTWYAGQPPWLVEGSVRDNVVMGGPWCARRYSRVLRAAALRPDLQLLPEGDSTRLGSHGSPLSGGQRVRVCVARALYSGARLVALDEPLAALDAPLARHVVARALVPAARAGRTVLVATNRLELLHYADLVIAMEEGRVSGVGRAGAGVGSVCSGGAVSRWAQLAAQARASAARAGAGPPGGAARERTRLRRELTRARFQRSNSDDRLLGINEATGAHLLAEVPTCAGGSWRRAARRRPALERQLSSPPPSVHNYKWRREVRRAVSADASNAALQREASLLRRLLRPRPHRTLTRWTPKTLRRLINSDIEAAAEDITANGVTDDTAGETTYASLTSNGTDEGTVVVSDSVPAKPEATEISTKSGVWYTYGRACGWWGCAYWIAAATAQALSVLADWWLTQAVAGNQQAVFTNEQVWVSVRTYALWCVCAAVAGGVAGAAGGAAGARARRTLHERLLVAVLHAPLHALNNTLLHRFSADIQVIDRKLPIAVSRWAQLALLCIAALLVNAVVAPYSLLALLPAVLLYFGLQSVYLTNARELQRSEAVSAASVVSVAAEAGAGAGAVRAGRLQPRMRRRLRARLDRNVAALLLLNSANRWLGLALDLVGAATVCVSLGVALSSAGGGAAAGLAGAYSLLLPAYLAHLAKCRADLQLHLAAVQRVRADTLLPQEDLREDCPIPQGWKRNGTIEFENVTVQVDPDSQPILSNINITFAPGEKIAICGRSGSGKSTLALTCAGASVVRAGRVRVCGEEAGRVPLRALRHRVVVLPQEPALFAGTLRENLDPLAVHTDAEIWQSLSTVGLFDFVSAQPAGLECSVRGGACGWSAGRVSRACAARAALHARLAGALVLDEPAAALDAPNERALLHALAAANAHAPLLVVAHRISSVRGFDRAIVLEEGRIVEAGEVRTLLAQPGSRLARLMAAAAGGPMRTVPS